MGLFGRHGKRRRERPGDLHIGDLRFDGWEAVSQFGDLPSAQALAGHLSSLGIICALTADWPLDRFGRGDIYLVVPADSNGDATAVVEGYDHP